MTLTERFGAFVYSEGISYADRGREEGGDYRKIAFLAFRTLELAVYDDASPLLPAIHTDAAAIQSRQGEPYRVSGCGQTVTLGWGMGGRR